MMTKPSPIEAKVYAATIGGAAGSQIAAFLLWLVGVTLFGAPVTSAEADAAIAAVPGPVATFVRLLVTAGCTFAGGYLARHTPRESLPG